MAHENEEARVTGDDGSVVARLDLDRIGRCGAPEAVFAMGKTPRETLDVTRALVERQGHALITRADPETLALLRREWPGLRVAERAAAALAGTPPPVRPELGRVAVVCAGTSDLPVAEEAALALEYLGLENELVADVGVAGLHRLLRRLDDLRRARVVVAVAGMEGALPSVLAGLVAAPVLAVPTSVGYGANLGGLSALLGMLTSCAPGISVVNIDNGFGAAMAAARIMNAPPPASLP